MSFCSKCGKEIREEDEFCPNCGTKIEAPHKIDSPMSVAEQAKIEGVKQRIAGYNSRSTVFIITTFVCAAVGYLCLALEFDATDLTTRIQFLSVASILLIFGIICLVLFAYTQIQATELRKKLKKGGID